MCDQLAVVYECFAYASTLYASIWSEMGHCCINLFLPAKTLFMLVYSRLLYLVHAPEGLTS